MEICLGKVFGKTIQFEIYECFFYNMASELSDFLILLRKWKEKNETFPTMFYLDNNSSVLVTFSENNHFTSWTFD